MRWDSGAHPKWVSSAGGDAGPSCGGGCAPAAKETCLCDIESIDTKAVFTDPTRVPTVAELEARLFVGAAPPASLNYRYSPSSAVQPPDETRLHEVYRLCTSSVCSGSKNKDGVEVYLRQLPPPTSLSSSSSSSGSEAAGASSGSASTITAIGGDGNGGSPSADIAIDGNMATHYKSGWNRKDPFVQVFGTKVRCSGARLHKEEQKNNIFVRHEILVSNQDFLLV